VTVGSLFAGIGGFDLAAERAGFEVKWQVEIDDYATKVLEKHWPHVKRYRDIRAIDWNTVESVDLVCGGFPCQPHSSAGRRLGSADDRDLWPEVVRCLRGLGPRWFLGENVAGLLSSEAGRFFGTVLGDLAASGYDAEWNCLPASAVGAPHRRDRVWIMAYPTYIGCERSGVARGWRDGPSDGGADVADASRLQQGRAQQRAERERVGAGGESVISDADGRRQQERQKLDGESIADSTDGDSCRRHLDGCGCADWWLTEPDVGRVAHGVPARVDRLRGLGNAIVPQVAQWIFERIKEAEGVSVARGGAK
jgi:DNA (cytosine-5)-methyltransferase 1